MKVRFNSAVKLLALAAAMAVASGASAQSKGQLTVSVGANKITPKIKSGNMSAPALPNSKGAVSSDTQPVMVFTYGLTDNISAQTALGTPYKHKIYGAGAIEGIGQIGEVQALPATAFLQYRFFKPESFIRPFVGLGATYALFMKEKGSGKLTALTNPGGEPTTFKVKDKLTWSAQVGVAVNISERWFADVTVIKTKLATTTTFSTNQTQYMKMDPVATMVTVGYKF